MSPSVVIAEVIWLLYRGRDSVQAPRCLCALCLSTLTVSNDTLRVVFRSYRLALCANKNIAAADKNGSCTAGCMISRLRRLHLMRIMVWALLAGTALRDRFWSRVIFLTEDPRYPASRFLPCALRKQKHRCGRQKRIMHRRVHDLSVTIPLPYADYGVGTPCGNSAPGSFLSLPS
jgi:hypothetical protein